MKEYKLVLNKKQMKVLQDVCELRFRIDLLQEWELAEILAQMDDLDLDPRNPKHKEIFNSYLERREHLSVIIKALFEIASPMTRRISIGRKRNPDSLIAEDIFLAIRHQLWKDSPKEKILYKTTDSYPPMSVSEEGLPGIEAINE